MDPLPHEGAGDDGRYRKNREEVREVPKNLPERDKKLPQITDLRQKERYMIPIPLRHTGKTAEARKRKAEYELCYAEKTILRETAENVRDDNRIGERTGKRNRSCGNGTPEGKKIGRDTEYPQKKVGIT